jgi:hypothetical protein
MRTKITLFRTPYATRLLIPRWSALSFVRVRLVFGLELECRMDGTKEHLTVDTHD